MISKIIAFVKGKFPPSVKWEEVREDILRSCKEMKVKFEVSSYYYKVTSGEKTWYWCKDTGKFDGTSWDMNES